MNGILHFLKSIVREVNDDDLNKCFECVNTKLNGNTKVEGLIDAQFETYQLMISEIAAGKKINTEDYSTEDI